MTKQEAIKAIRAVKLDLLSSDFQTDTLGAFGSLYEALDTALFALGDDVRNVEKDYQ